MTPICKTCLKYPICKFKQEVICKDLVAWIMQNDTSTVAFQERLTSIEKQWGKEISVMTSSGMLKFKKEKDQYSCLIAKNM